jgi:hypothetical protein
MPVNKKSITTIAPAARPAAYRGHADLLDQTKAVIPSLVQAQLGLAGTKVSAADLARQFEAAHRRDDCILTRSREGRGS